MTPNRSPLLLSILTMLSFPALGQEPDISLLGTVRGHSEQPKVMYILPWQRPSILPFEQDLVAELEDGLFVTLDRDEFIRELNYRAMTSAGADNGAEERTKILLNTK